MAPPTSWQDRESTEVGASELDPSELDLGQHGGKPTTVASPEDPFEPLRDIPDEGNNILTFRALAIGVLCGALINASNIYLGLKSGWSVSANLFASITAFSLLRMCSSLPLLGGSFGPRETNIAQTTAIAAGGMSNVFVSAFPAMYQLGLLRSSPAQDFWRLVSVTAVGGFFGFFFATPLRQFFIVLAARGLNLIFPTPSATAVTIRDMHRSFLDGSDVARRKMGVVTRAFAVSGLLRVASPFAPGILSTWHVFTWYSSLVPQSSVALALESWGWYIELSPAFVATGMLVGLNAAVSYFAGTLLAWGIVGPLTVTTGLAFVREDPSTGLSLYHDISDTFATAHHPGPRYWMLWPGIIGMVAVSLAEMATQWRALVLPAKLAWRAVCASAGYNKPVPSALASRDEADEVQECAPAAEMITVAMWLPGLILTIIIGCLVMGSQYDIPVRETLSAFALAFGFSFLTTQTTGATDITPIIATSASSQVIMGAESSGQGWSQSRAQQMGLLAGALSAICAMQAADLTGDFRVGYLLRTSPRRQWLAQGVGTAFAAIIAPAMYTMFASAYECIHDPGWDRVRDGRRCDFVVPSAAAWRAVAISSTSAGPAIPRSSLAFAAVLAGLGVGCVILRHILLGHRRRRDAARLLPNMMLVCLGFVIPATVYATAILAGALLAWIWARRAARSFDTYGYAVAAGLIAGEGFGGVLNAALQIMGLSGDALGTKIGCPGGYC